MTIRITRTVATIIQAVSPLFGTGAGAAAGAAAAGPAAVAVAVAAAGVAPVGHRLEGDVQSLIGGE